MDNVEKKRKTKAEAEQEQNDQQEQNSKVPTDSVSSNEQITSKSETSDVIDVRIICKKMWAKKIWYVIVLTIVAVVSGLIIFDVPRYYTSETTMA